MKLHLREFRDQEQELHFTTEKNSWLSNAIKDLDEHELYPSIRPAHLNTPAPPRKGRADFRFRRLEDVFLLEGDIETSVTLYCSNCGQPIEYPLHPKFTGLFTQDPAFLASDAEVSQDPVSGRAKGVAKSSRSEDTDRPYDYEMTLVETDYIELDQVVQEYLRLEIPLKPVCLDPEATQCHSWQKQWNANQRVNDRLTKNTGAFSALKNFKIKSKS